MKKTSDGFIDQFVQLGIFNKIQNMAQSEASEDKGSGGIIANEVWD